MRITAMHLTYWRQKKAPAPSWASELIAARPPGRNPQVNRLINCQYSRTQAEFDSRDPQFVIERTIGILRSNRLRHGHAGLIKSLLSMSNEPSPRGPMCKRWLFRLGYVYT